ncbi:unnamed protein product, partial [Adineta steineri]
SSCERTLPRLSPTSLKREWTCSTCQSPNDQKNPICYVCEEGRRPKQDQKQAQISHSPRRPGHSSNERRSRNRSYSPSPSATGSRHSPSDQSDNESYTSKSKGRYHYEIRQRDRPTESSQQYLKERFAYQGYSNDDSRDRHHSTTPNRKGQHGSDPQKEKKGRKTLIE